MTSSLVGSEMCIRDRSRDSLSDLLQIVQVSGQIPLKGTCALQMNGSRCSVSYTHLTLPTICSV
eukprot:286929-Prorocentrum_lima.AAC.1